MKAYVFLGNLLACWRPILWVASWGIVYLAGRAVWADESASGFAYPLIWAEGSEPALSNDLPAMPGDFSTPHQPGLAQWTSVPADFEPMEALVLSAGLLAQQDPDLLAQMVEALHEQIRLVGLVSDGRQRQKVEKILADRKLLGRAIRLVEIPHNTLWIRDYGPIFFRLPDLHSAAYDAEYPDPRRRLDDVVPTRLAALFGASVFPLPMVLEGGNLLTNGQGLALTTQTAMLRQVGGYVSEASFRQLLSQHLGIDSLVILEPLHGEPTGHVDMFACFTGPDTVLVGQYDPKEDPENAALLDRNAAILAGCRTSAGPLRVIRIPMPGHRDGIWRTYTNVIFANRLLLVPTYPTADPTNTQRVLEIYRRLLAGWKVIGLDTSRLIPIGGGLRCITLGIPAPTPTGSVGAAIGSTPGLAWQHGLPEIPTKLSYTPAFDPGWFHQQVFFCPAHR